MVFEEEAYEDSPQFTSQLSSDIGRIFTYVGYKGMFETDGVLDMNKVIVGVQNGPGYQEEYTLDYIVRYLKRRGYYLDENFSVQGSPLPWTRMRMRSRLISRNIIRFPGRRCKRGTDDNGGSGF